jgi:hypothetical protein
MAEELYALEWSHRTGNLNVQPVRRLLSINRNAYASDMPVNDYIPLHIGPRAECEQAAEAIRGTIAMRAQGRRMAVEVIAAARGDA